MMLTISKIKMVNLPVLTKGRAALMQGTEINTDKYFLIPVNMVKYRIVLKVLSKISLIHLVNLIPAESSERAKRPHLNSEEHLRQNIAGLIEAHIDDDSFNIGQFCNTVGMSRAQLYRKFRSLGYSSPHYYIMNCRLQKARELLLTTDMNVSEVAYRTGFKNLSHFSRLFTGKFGKNPRKLIR
jgi:AraC-like DNA-binding protein